MREGRCGVVVLHAVRRNERRLASAYCNAQYSEYGILRYKTMYSNRRSLGSAGAERERRASMRVMRVQ